VKITSVTANNRKKAFEVTTRRGQWLFPYGRALQVLDCEIEVIVRKRTA
jgi:hypothetical protein